MLGEGWSALLARPQTCDSSHLETITRNNGGSRGPGCLRGPGPRLFRAKEPGPCSHLPPPTSITAVCLALAHTAPKGPSCQGKSALNYRHGGWWPGWVPRSQARSQRLRLTQLQLCEQHSGYYCSSGGMWGEASVSPQEVQVPPGLAAYHVLA